MGTVKSSAAILSKDPYKLYIRIEGDLPRSMNKVMRSHWGKNYSQSEKWKMIVGNAVERHLPEDVLQFAQISITRHSHRMLDFDGMVASFKAVVDGLKSLVIEDDSWKLIGSWRVNQQFRAKKLGGLLEIWVTEVFEGPESRH